MPVNKPVKNMILVALFTALSAIGAFIKIPLPYVSITLQTIFVLLAGILLGKKPGAFSQLVYVVLGLVGIPIFTQGGGPGYILKPSFGYLIGFIAAAYLAGLLTEGKEVNFKTSLLASFAATMVIYLFGVPYLYLILKTIVGVEITFSGALKTGMLLFLPGDLLKMLIVSYLAPEIYRRLSPSL